MCLFYCSVWLYFLLPRFTNQKVLWWSCHNMRFKSFFASLDSWISQSASFPRNQKQPGVDSPSPAAPLPKPPCQSSSGSQQPQRTMKVTCANCKKPLKKGQTAYQRKGSSHLFCSTTCLSAFSHKPAPKKSCTMCKKYDF